jgi:hypothetical protein
MRIEKIEPRSDYTIQIKLNNGKSGLFNVKPYLQYEAFNELKKIAAFKQVVNGGYFIEWSCGADLSIDTIIAHLQ